MELEVDRNYNWDLRIPKIKEVYYESGDELKKLEAVKGGRWRIEGPTGCGKTMLVEYFAAKNKLPLFTIQGRYMLNPADLIGRPTIIGNEVKWIDGTLTKALLCSQERECVLLVDEFNRMEPRCQAIFLEAADYRCQVTIEARDEVIRGIPENLYIMATLNRGVDYFVNRLDAAVEGRFSVIELDYLGLKNRDAEIELLMERCGIKYELADLLVTTANKIRIEAKSGKSVITLGIPTRNLIKWAELITAYFKRGIGENPIIEAAKDAVINSIYEGQAKTTVMQIILSMCDLPEEEIEQII
uniref:AAA family ATPase n=1 Tax=Geoglobus ahangari TaxID=113653 RepID=A0A7C3YQ70_9EURY